MKNIYEDNKYEENKFDYQKYCKHLVDFEFIPEDVYVLIFSKYNFLYRKTQENIKKIYH